MRTGETYLLQKHIPAYDENDDDCELRAGAEYTGVSFDIVSDSEGKKYRLTRFHAANPDWFFSSGFNARKPLVTVMQFVRELVRTNEGLQVDMLFDMACRFWICQTPPQYNSFTSTLSADERIVMRDEQGKEVKGTKHNKRCCTYHMRRA